MKNFLLWCLIFLLGYGYAQTQENKIDERIFYVPYDKLNDLNLKPDTNIYLPYKEYNKLCSELKDLQKKLQQKEDNIVISEGNYNCVWKDELFYWKSQFKIHTFSNGIHSLSLPFKNITIVQATLDEKPALLQCTNNGYELVFETKENNEKLLSIDFITKVEKQHLDDVVLSLGIPRTPISHLTIEIEENEERFSDVLKDMFVTIQPSLQKKVTYQETKLSIEAMLGNTDNITISFQSKAVKPIQSIIHAENSSHLEIAENVFRLHSILSYKTLQGDFSNCTIEIPENYHVFAVRNIQGGAIQNWNLQGNTLTINFPTPMKEVVLDLQLDQTISNIIGNWELPTLTLKNIEHEKGFYAITVDSWYTLQLTQIKNLIPIDIEELPADMNYSKIQFAFQYWTAPLQIAGTIEIQNAVYDVINNMSMITDGIVYNLNASLYYQIQKSYLFETDIEIPQDYIILDVDVKNDKSNKTELKSYQDDMIQNKRILHIVFEHSMRSPFIVSLKLQQKFETEEEKRVVAFPTLHVLNAKNESGNFGIGVQSNFDITVDKIENLFPIDVKKLYEKGEKPSKKSLNIGLQFYDFPRTAEFTIKKKETFITAVVTNQISIKNDVLFAPYTIAYDIKYAGVSSFSFSLPLEIGRSIKTSQIHDNKGMIQQILMNDTEQTRTFTIKTQKEILGSYEISISYETKLNLSQPISIHCYPLVTQNTKQEYGFVAFHQNSEISMNFTQVKGLEALDVRDSTFTGDRKNIVTLFKYTNSNYVLQAKFAKQIFEPVLNTAIQHLHITSTINKDFTVKNEVIAVIVNNRKQMLDFIIPENSQILSVACVKEIPARNVQIRQEEFNNLLEPLNWISIDGKTKFKVNLASNVSSNAPFVLVIHYDSLLKKGEMAQYGTFSIPSLSFDTVPVSYFTWTLGLPTEYDYINFHSNFSQNFTADYSTWGILREIVAGAGIQPTALVAKGEMGVIPVSTLQGKKFSFYKANGDGSIDVTYIHYALHNVAHIILFLIICIILIFIPRICSISRLSLIFFFFAVSLLCSVANFYYLANFYITSLVATCFISFFAMIFQFIIAIKKLFHPKKEQ